MSGAIYSTHGIRLLRVLLCGNAQREGFRTESKSAEIVFVPNPAYALGREENVVQRCHELQ